MDLTQTATDAAQQCARTAQAIVHNIEKVLEGKHQQVELALAAIVAGGHLLIEDVPGLGKTMLARALAVSVGLSFKRIQFTADLMPSDIVGGPVYNPKDGSFTLRPGPVFANIVLADEINRANPRAQSALLECMEEGQITLDGQTLPLPAPFAVLVSTHDKNAEIPALIAEGKGDVMITETYEALHYSKADPRLTAAFIDAPLTPTNYLGFMLPVDDADYVRVMNFTWDLLNQRGTLKAIDTKWLH